ncbi:MAG: ABC transporter permease [Bacillota bacterium]|nr:ABC transporter permease [Bacillota bacterium]
MRNPLYKRLSREFKSDFGKYLVIFLFIAGLIALVSGFLVADNSMIAAYNEGFEKYNIENGNFELMLEADDELIDALEQEGVTIYDQYYVDETVKENDSTMRVYRNREKINLPCLMEGRMPEQADEIAIDRMYADNNEIAVGDSITLGGNQLTVTGLVALPDYSCLFENNTDMMFDSLTFCVAVMTDEGFESLGEDHLHYVYAWKYDEEPADEREEKEVSDDFMKVIAENAVITNFIPRYANQAIQFTGEDMGGDKAMFILFLYIVVVIIAFVFAITTSNTIAEEASVIGTLRASGYTRGELIRHYLISPLLVTLLAAVVGNILGYTVLKEYMVGLYYGSYSLPTYETLWNGEAFVETTVVPFVLMLVINLTILVSKLKLSPLKFLRHDLSKRTKKKAFRLNTKIPFLTRFRLRIIFQNIPNYITLLIGIMFASLIMVFGMMFGPLLEDYSKEIDASMFADYQYVLKAQIDTKAEGAEKYCVTTLQTTTEKYPTEDIMVYGIEDGSDYVDIDFKEGEVHVSDGYMIKYGLKDGDSITLKDKYSDDIYEFTVAGEYEYPAALAVFLPRREFNEIFDKKEDYYSGYLSDKELDDIEDAYISTIITQEDLTKISRQLTVSMGDFMVLFEYFGIVMFLLLMYLLSKQIIEKNAGAISMVKILGYSNGEIGGLYIVATTVAVVVSLFLSMPVCNYVLRWLFSGYLYTVISGYFPYMVSNTIYVKIIIYGIVSYAVVAATQMFKIGRIPKSDALKNVE